MAAFSWVGPNIDLSFSSAYDLASFVVLDWLVHMLTSGRLDALMAEPPCTTFSSAAYPSCRSYTQPLGFFPLQEKALLGNILALKALLLLHFCAITGTPWPAPHWAGAAKGGEEASGSDGAGRGTHDASQALSGRERPCAGAHGQKPHQMAQA